LLHNGEQEIERERAPPAEALRVALMMLARRGRLESGDVLTMEDWISMNSLSTANKRNRLLLGGH
jgi:hypothetical protein